MCTAAYFAALATVLAQTISGISCLIFAFRSNPYFKLDRAHFAFDREISASAVRLGLPFIMTAIPGVGVWGIWWTAGLTWSLSALFCVMRYLTWWTKQKRGA